jgi:hypothetical protein
MHFIVIILLVLSLIIALMTIKPITSIKNRSLLKDLTTLKTSTVNMLNKLLKIDTTKLVDFHIPDVHNGQCPFGTIDRILSPDELLKLSMSDPSMYKKLVACGYTRTVGLLHSFALWSSISKSKDIKSFKYFVDCINRIQWTDPTLFQDFHSNKSKIGKCIV